jgi:hypothetical protein
MQIHNSELLKLLNVPYARLRVISDRWESITEKLSRTSLKKVSFSSSMTASSSVSLSLYMFPF